MPAFSPDAQNSVPSTEPSWGRVDLFLIEYKEVIEGIEALPCNQWGQDKSWVLRAEETDAGSSETPAA